MPQALDTYIIAQAQRGRCSPATGRREERTRVFMAVSSWHVVLLNDGDQWSRMLMHGLHAHTYSMRLSQLSGRLPSQLLTVHQPEL